MASEGNTRPFAVDWPAERRAEIARRVADYVLPPAPADAGWSLGCDPEFLARLRARWLDGFDCERAVAELNRFPQFMTRVDGLDIHYLRIPAETDGAPALLLIHGWPSSTFEFHGVIDRLTHPSRFGGDPADAVELIVPSLPGYGCGGKPGRIIGPREIARLFHRLMIEELGFERYYSHGGDWGAVVTSWLAVDHEDHVPGIHLGMIALPMPARPETPDEEEWVARFARIQREMGGYSHLQGSKPQSLAWLAAGNPVGQAAWLAERYHDWSDLTERDFEQVFDLDWLLTAILVYVMNDSFASAAYLYNGLARESGGSVTTVAKDGHCAVPTAFTSRLADPRIVPPPRARVEKVYNIVRWTDATKGGHFPAHERPEEFVADLQGWMRQMRCPAGDAPAPSVTAGTAGTAPA
jgi:pimeloyl-ACP methyl ester carboxylesterase